MGTRKALARLACVLFLLSASGLRADFVAAVRWIPDSANSLALIRGRRILDSELSRSQGWRKDQMKAFQAGLSLLPPTVDHLLIASQIDFDTAQPRWRVSVMEQYGPEIPISQIARRTGGNIEVLDGRNGVRLPNNTYVVRLDEHRIVAMTPADRQTTSRWLRRGGAGSTGAAPYLMQAARHADANADILIAVDLEECVDPTRVRSRLAEVQLVKEADVEAVAESLAGLRGIMLGITIRDKITGALRADFANGHAVLEPYGKSLFLRALADRGVLIDDMESWRLKAGPTGLVLSGELSVGGLRDVLSFVRHSLTEDLFATSPGESESDAEPNIGTRSKDYFDKLVATSRQIRKARGRSLNTYAGLFEHYAREIDELPVVGIDTDLVKFGTFVSDSFREVAGVLRGSEFTRRSMQAGMRDSFYVERYGIYGGYASGVDYSGERQAIAVQQNVLGESQAREILRTVENQMAEARRGLSAKYQINF